MIRAGSLAGDLVGSYYRSRKLNKGAMTHYATTQRAKKSAASLLVIGTDPKDRDTFSDALQAEAYEIVFCDSLDAADLRLFDRPFDACIIELDDSVERCFDLLATIKRKCPLTEVIILSRLADEELWIESIQRDAYEFLSKPLDHKDFQRIVNNIVEKNRCRHQ
jgi:DNA-binding NtrC family response regulator